MDRYKKAGIILAVTALVIALIVIGVANRISNGEKIKEQEEINSNVSVTVQPENNVVTDTESKSSTEGKVGAKTDGVIDESNNSSNTTQAPVEQAPTEQTVVNTFSSFSEKELLSLVPGQDITEVMLVANKGVVLLSDNKKNERQIMHALDLFTTQGNTLHYYVSQSVYDSVEVGTKLNVTYSIYTNDNKIEFPVIKNIAVVN